VDAHGSPVKKRGKKNKNTVQERGKKLRDKKPTQEAGSEGRRKSPRALQHPRNNDDIGGPCGKKPPQKPYFFSTSKKPEGGKKGQGGRRERGKQNRRVPSFMALAP